MTQKEAVQPFTALRPLFLPAVGTKFKQLTIAVLNVLKHFHRLIFTTSAQPFFGQWRYTL